MHHSSAMDGSAPLPDRGGVLDDDARLYARSSSDDKGPIIAMLAAIDALRASRIPLRSTSSSS